MLTWARSPPHGLPVSRRRLGNREHDLRVGVDAGDDGAAERLGLRLECVRVALEVGVLGLGGQDLVDEFCGDEVRGRPAQHALVLRDHLVFGVVVSDEDALRDAHRLMVFGRRRDGDILAFDSELGVEAVVDELGVLAAREIHAEHLGALRLRCDSLDGQLEQSDLFCAFDGLGHLAVRRLRRRGEHGQRGDVLVSEGDDKAAVIGLLYVEGCTSTMRGGGRRQGMTMCKTASGVSGSV